MLANFGLSRQCADIDQPLEWSKEHFEWPSLRRSVVGILLQRFSARGRVVPELNESVIREIFVKQYRLIYEIRADQVVILAFLHGARLFPERI
ncbi:MAG: type II toxin-antitoxin system RelE/ParE family toxin [Bryobacterales bacterium]|nr:type II toxin-antitoxin system RelE/ParE family toxin [Bryobacterales bacterium]